MKREQSGPNPRLYGFEMGNKWDQKSCQLSSRVLGWVWTVVIVSPTRGSFRVKLLVHDSDGQPASSAISTVTAMLSTPSPPPLN